jgi:hypothetical protein
VRVTHSRGPQGQKRGRRIDDFAEAAIGSVELIVQPDATRQEARRMAANVAELPVPQVVMLCRRRSAGALVIPKAKICDADHIGQRTV